MHCIVLAAPPAPHGGSSWRIRRSVEVLGYHQAKDDHDACVRILFVLFAENLLKDKPNSLEILHAGNVKSQVVKSWPLPLHPDEKRNKISPGNGVLYRLYGRAFEQSKSGILVWKESLTTWDQWQQRQEPTEIKKSSPILSQVWPSGDDLPSADSHVPFTVLSFGPFKEEGLHLIAFTLEFAGKSYAELVEREDCFSVDGPERLLSFIRYVQFAGLGEEVMVEWRAALGAFDEAKRRLTGDSYDIIVLGQPLADTVVPVEDKCRNGIWRAPIQLTEEGEQHQRYVTTDQFFTIGFAYDRAAGPSKRDRLVYA